MNAKSFGLLVISVSILWACASQKPPPGGPKDTAPPELVISFPKNLSTQFHGRYIRLVFDEIIEVKNLRGELIISPDPELKYKEKIKSKSLIINLLDTLRPNTTYTFNFGNAVSDITESNIPENLILAFSTGMNLDSGLIKGRVLAAQTLQPSKKYAIIGLYPPTDTLDPEKHKPTYYTKTDNTGAFTLRNLPDQLFEIFAITDNNKNKLFDPQTEKLGFISSTIRPEETEDTVKLLLVKQDFRSPKLMRTYSGVNYFKISFSRGLRSFIPESDSISYVLNNKNKDVILFPGRIDTADFGFKITDSLGASLDTIIKIFTQEDGKKYEKSNSLRSTPKSSQGISHGDSIQLFTNLPIETINQDSIFLVLNGDTLTIRSQDIQILSFPWTYRPPKNANEIGMILKKGSLIDVLKDTLQTQSFKFSLKRPENYGQLEGSVETEKDCYLIEVLDIKYKTVAFRKNPNKFIFMGLDPGTYMIRSMVDENCNGKWDAGDYKQKMEPEKFFFYEEKLQLKANWIQQDKLVKF
jgi:Bacterial Ig-like domain